MPPKRFVILHHLAPTGEHWDFMIEQEDCLFTWQMMADPAGRDACPIDCIRIKNHRKLYLDYEGPVSGGRGIVTRVDQGRHEILGVDDHSWTLRLQGRWLFGDFGLVRADPDSQSRWIFIAL